MIEIDSEKWITTPPSELYQQLTQDYQSLSINNQIYALKIFGDKGHSDKVKQILVNLESRELDTDQRMMYKIAEASYYNRLSEFDLASDCLQSVDRLIQQEQSNSEQLYWRLLSEKIRLSVTTNQDQMDEARESINNIAQLFEAQPRLKLFEEPEYWIIRSTLERKLRDREWWSSLKTAVSSFKRVDDPDYLGYTQLYQAFMQNVEQQGDKAVESYKIAMEQFRIGENLIGQLKVDFSLGLFYLRIGKYNEAIEYLAQSLDLAKRINSKHDVVRSSNSLSLAYENRGDYDAALAINLENLAIVEQHGLEKYKGEILGKIGRIHDFRGEYDQAIDFFSKAIELHRENNNKSEFGYVLTLVGSVLLKQGNLNAAEQKFSESLIVFREINFEQLLAYSYGYLGIVHYFKGEIDIALDQINQSLAILERLDNVRNIAISKHTKAMILFSTGDTELAITTMKQALDIKQTLGSEQLITVSLFYLILFLIEIEEEEKAKNYYDQLVELQTRTEDQIIKNHEILAHAIILQSSPRASTRFEGQKLLLELIKEKTLDFNLKVITLIHLIDQLLFEYQATPEISILEEILVYLKTLSDLSRTNNSYHLWIETIILESKLSLVEGNLDEAYEHLLRAREIAKKHGLGTLLQKIDAETTELESKYLRWEELITQNASMKDKFEEAQINSYMKAASKLFCSLSVE